MRKALGSLVLMAAVALPAAAQPFGSGSRLGAADAALGLSDAQKEALHAAVASEKEAILAAVEAEKGARVALDEAVRAVPYDAAAVAAAAGPVAAADADLAALRARLYAKCFAVFTPPQARKADMLLAIATERIGEGIHRFVEHAAQDPAALPRYARLALTAEQRQQVDDAYTAHGPEIAALLAEEKEARTALLSAIRRTTTDETQVRTASASVSAVDLRLAQVRAQVHAAIAPILTESQAAKMAKVHGALRAFLLERAASFVHLASALL